MSRPPAAKARPTVARWATTLVAGAVAAMSLSACSSSSSEAVVKVAGNPISKAQIEHWTKVEAVLAYQVIPKTPPPAGVIPDPPDYGACIAYLRAHPPIGSAGQAKPSQAALKSACEQRRQLLKSKMTGFLITYQWLNGEARERGIEVSDAEVQKALLAFRRKELPSEREFQAYLDSAGMSLADALLVQRDTVLGTKINQAIERAGLSAAQQQAALKAFTRKWTAKTNCKSGYVVPGCRQYRGSEEVF